MVENAVLDMFTPWISCAQKVSQKKQRGWEWDELGALEIEGASALAGTMSSPFCRFVGPLSEVGTDLGFVF